MEKSFSDDADRGEDASSLRKNAGHGAAWSIAGFGTVQVIRFASNMLLTRLLFEEAFGLMALVNALLQGLALFTDLGIGTSIIQSEHGNKPSFLRTAWTAQILRGVVLMCLALAITIPFANFYGEAELLTIIPVVGLTALIGGFTSTKRFLAQRQLAFKRVAIFEIGTQVIGVSVTVIWALNSPSVWAFVAGSYASVCATTILSHFLISGPRDRMGWSQRDFNKLFNFGRWIFLSSVLTFLVSNADRLIFGKMIPLALLGVYSVALMIAQVPALLVSKLAFTTVFPVYTRTINTGGNLYRVFCVTRKLELLIAGWMLSGFIAGGDTVVRFIYDERYAEAGWILQFLSIAAWFATLEVTNGIALLAKGKSSLVAVCNGSKLIALMVSLPIGFYFGGFPGAVCALVLSDVIKYLVSVICARSLGLNHQRYELLVSLRVALSALAGWGGALMVRYAGVHILVEIFIVFIIVTLMWAPDLVSLLKRVRKEGFKGMFEQV